MFPMPEDEEADSSMLSAFQLVQRHSLHSVGGDDDCHIPPSLDFVLYQPKGRRAAAKNPKP